ncbi:hypothetical protein [uncultured Imperialibacter sp.]|uniref:hypothetical protein n=1 Tax=uncultured Imperialibacter sp. TaxID=1672639 RepID=UPI0030D96907
MTLKTTTLRGVIRLQIMVNQLIRPLPIQSAVINSLILILRLVLAAVVCTDWGRALLGLSLRTELDPDQWKALGMTDTWQMAWINHLEVVFRWLEGGIIAVGLNTRFMVLAVVCTMVYQSFWASPDANLVVQFVITALVLILLVLGSGRYGLDQLIVINGRKTKQHWWATAFKKLAGTRAVKSEMR